MSRDRYERWVRSETYREERPRKARVIGALCGEAIREAERVVAADGTFDFVVLNHVYEHVEDQAGLFRELHRQLESTWGGIWARLWSAARRLPDGLVDAILRVLFPQWFFRVSRPDVAGEGGARGWKLTEADSDREACE